MTKIKSSKYNGHHKIILALNTLEPSTWTTHVEPSLTDFLLNTFGEHFPAGGKIFHELVDDEHDITPTDEASVQRLLEAAGHPSTFHVMMYPADPGTLAVSFTLLMVSVAIGFLFPKDKRDPGRPPREGSANNTLGNRQNRTRLLGRVPDIYGTVRSVPDLIAVPWVYYLNHQQAEVCVYCIGKGTFEVLPENVFEGDMRAQSILDMSVEVYNPGVLPTFGSPAVQIGNPIGFGVYNVYQVEGVIGQTLFSRNAFTLHGSIPFPEMDSDDENADFGVFYRFMAFSYAGAGVGHIYVPFHGNDDGTEITSQLAVGDILECRYAPSQTTLRPFSRSKEDISNALDGIGAAPNLSDNLLGYTVVSMTPITVVMGSSTLKYVDIVVSVPAGVQTQWETIDTFVPAPTLGWGGIDVLWCGAVLITPLLNSAIRYKNQAGPFFVDDPTMTSINCNFVAERGLYVDDTKSTVKIVAKITVFATPCDATGSPTGPDEEFTFELKGSGSDLTTKALTAVVVPSFTGRCLVAALRTDLTNWRVEDIGQNQRPYRNHTLPIVGQDPSEPYPPNDWIPAIPYKAITGIVQDEVKWTHCYSFSDPPVSAFNDTTIVMSQVIASKATNLIKDRKLSMIVTRKLNVALPSSGPLVATTLPEVMFLSILKDQQLGNILNAEIDYAGINAAFSGVRDFFQDDITRFGHTWDSEDTTLEDMLSGLAESCFCVAYREGQVIKVKPEVATDFSTVLFNHRNILPESQARTVTFGTEADYDGVKVDYFDDAANTIRTLTVPNEGAKKPRELTVAGLRDPVRAAMHAWRAYNRILYQNMGVEFEATQEAALALINDKILVADTNRDSSGRQDGEIIFVSGTTVRTSQPVTLIAGNSAIFIQHTNGTVEGINIVSSPDPQTLILATAPAGLVVDAAAGVPTTYMVVADASTTPTGFLIDNKSAQGRLTWSIQAHNYSHGYYFVDGLNVWINPKLNSLLENVSAYSRVSTVTGGSSTSDVLRGLVYAGGIGDNVAVIEAPGTTPDVNGYNSYTKALWVYKNATGTATDLISYNTGAGANEDRLLISSSDVLRVFHAGVAYGVVPSFPLAVWTHIVVIYVSSISNLFILINGEVVVDVGSVPLPGSRSDLVFFQDLDGMADDARLYYRAMSVAEARELFQKTRLS